MHMLVNVEYIAKTLSNYMNVETGELALYDFLDNTIKGIQHALGNVNNFEIVYDEDNNIHRIIDNTTIPGVRDSTKGIVVFNANLLQTPNNGTNNKIGGSFIKNVNFKTKLSNNFATMTTIGAQKNGNAVGSNSTMLSKWNDGLIDRIITDRGNPNYTAADDTQNVESVYVRNVLALQDLNTLVNQTLVSDKEIDSFRGAVSDLFHTELGKFTNDPASSLKGVGFIPFDLELTMLGLSGPRIYEAYTINTTLLPSSYKDKIQFICTGVSHKIADGEWTTTLNSIAGPIPSNNIYEPPTVKVKNDAAQEANDDSNNNNNNIDFDKRVKGADIARRLMTDLSITNFQAAAIVGNFIAESSLIPDRVQGGGIQRGLLKLDGITGYGYAQWTFITLQQELAAYAQSQGVDYLTTPLTDEINYGFFIQQIKESKRATLLSDLKAATDIRTATELILKRYERPADQSNAALTKRTNYAQQVLDNM